MKKVGVRIKQIRMEMGWTQEKLARKADLSKSFMSDIENGKTRVSGDNLLKIAEALGASLDYLMKGNSESKKDNPEPIEIPMDLSQAAEELELSFRDTKMLLQVNNSILARRRSGEKRPMSIKNWTRLYYKLKEFEEGSG